MINQTDRKRIIDLINREVVPAIGCTEPAAVSLCVAKATEILGSLPEKIELRLSGNIIKNAMGVGIPGTGMIGLPIAVALGASVGKSEYGLEVLRDVTPEAVEAGKRYIAEKRISVKLAEDAPSNLHIDVTVSGNGHSARAVISRAHTNFIFLVHDGETLLEEKPQTEESVASDDIKLNLAMVYDFAMTSPLEEISFILKAKELNLAAAELAFKGNYGHSLGSTMRSAGTKYFGDTPMEHMVAYTSAACDARMGGAPVAVMSNRKRQPGNHRHHACRQLRAGHQRHGGTDHPRPCPQPSDKHIHQAEPRTPLSPLRMRGGLDRCVECACLSDGRRLS